MIDNLDFLLQILNFIACCWLVRRQLNEESKKKERIMSDPIGYYD